LKQAFASELLCESICVEIPVMSQPIEHRGTIAALRSRARTKS
jgi:hypothetical protein